MAVAWFWGWGIGGGLVFGLSISVASTVVLLKELEERNLVPTRIGRVAVGWLIVEDLAMVLALVMLPTLATTLGGQVPGAEHGVEPTDLTSMALVVAITLAKVVAFTLLAMLVGPRVVPWVLIQAARTGSRELFTLAVLAIAMGIAFGASSAFGVSFALGAFFAGVIMSESQLSHRAAENSLPLQNAFSVLFFVSIGMLFDPWVLVQHPIEVLITVLLIVVVQVSHRGRGGAVASLSRRHGAPGRSQPVSDRRVLLHPCSAGRRAGAYAGRRARLHPGRFNPVHHPQSGQCSPFPTACRNGSMRAGRLRQPDSARHDCRSSPRSWSG